MKRKQVSAAPEERSPLCREGHFPLFQFRPPRRASGRETVTFCLAPIQSIKPVVWPSPVALYFTRRWGSLAQSIFAQYTVATTKQHNAGGWSLRMLEAYILRRAERQREPRGDRGRGKERERQCWPPPSSPCSLQCHSIRLSGAVHPRVREKYPWVLFWLSLGAIVPHVLHAVFHMASWADPHKTQIVSCFQTLHCCL